MTLAKFRGGAKTSRGVAIVKRIFSLKGQIIFFSPLLDGGYELFIIQTFLQNGKPLWVFKIPKSKFVHPLIFFPKLWGGVLTPLLA